MSEVKIEKVIGHLVEAEITTTGYFGDNTSLHEGRILYSVYNESLFFLPKGKRSNGYKLAADKIHKVKILKTDILKHDEYLTIYNNRERLIQEAQEKRMKLQEQQSNTRKERVEREAKAREEKKEKEIQEAKSLGGYEELEKEILDFYKSFDTHTNFDWVATVVTPLVNKLVNKSTPDVNSYPKYYFCKKSNPRFCAIIEQKLNIKLPSTQKGSVEKINAYLANK